MMVETNIFSLIAVCGACFTLGMSITHSIWSKKFLTYILTKEKEQDND